jgi:hypothetical protein
VATAVYEKDGPGWGALDNQMFLHSQSNEYIPRSYSSWSMAYRSSLALPSSTRCRISLMTLRRRLWNMLSLPGRQRVS